MVTVWPWTLGFRTSVGLKDSVFLIVKADPGANPDSCMMGIAAVLVGEKRPDRAVEHPLPSSAGVRNY